MRWDFLQQNICKMFSNFNVIYAKTEMACYKNLIVIVSRMRNADNKDYEWNSAKNSLMQYSV